MTPDTVQGGNSPATGTEAMHPWQRWQDWVNLFIGIWLFVATWVLSASVAKGSAQSAAAWNSGVLGIIVFVLALWSLAAPRAMVAEWINVIAGIWLFIAPWALAFHAIATAAAWNQWVFGIITFILALSVALTTHSLSGTAGTHAPHAT
ncbi:MAG: SPW repeat protein [Armatimonadetes bacterium]|nr:SPW repeat protein [Armatimonadota bacterium]